MTIKRVVKAANVLIQSNISRTKLGWYILFIVKIHFKLSSLRMGLKKNKSLDTLSLFNFRRNIHRIEKGLIYKDRKKAFAADYILDTVKIYAQAQNDIRFDENTLKWGESVLNKYFSVVDKTGAISEAHEVFEDLLTKFEPLNWTPYVNSQRVESQIKYEQLKRLSQRRRSVRFFEDRPVALEVVRKAVDVAAQSPSACNRQPFTYLFYNDPVIASKIASIPGGVSGYNLSNVVVVLGDYSAYFDVRDINAPVIDASLANMSFLFALETLGLGSVCINWPNLRDREKKIREIIEIKDTEFVIMLIGIGYPAPSGGIPYSGKRSTSHLLKLNDRIKNNS